MDLTCGPTATPGDTCPDTPAANGSFSQNVQRLGFYGEDSWRVAPHLIVNYGLRYDTTLDYSLPQAARRLRILRC